MRLSSLFATTIAAVYVLASPAPLNIKVDGISNVFTVVGEKDVTYPPASGSCLPSDGKIPPLPSPDEIKKHMLSPAEIAGKSLFYSGPHGYAHLAGTLAKAVGRMILADLWLDPNYPETWGNGSSVEKQFWDNASKAMAEISSGVVWVLLPASTTGTVWYKGTVWDRVEWPTLSGYNSNITEIIRVSPGESIYPKPTQSTVNCTDNM